MKVLYAGSFNPWHNGHQYVYDLACKMFSKENVIVGIGMNKGKDSDRNVFLDKANFLKWTMNPAVENVVFYDTLTANYCKENNIDLIVRGIRPGKSLEYEEDIMYWNKKIGNVETIFIPTPPTLNQLSSSVIRELNSFGEDVSEFCNPIVLARWKTGKTPTRIIYFGRSCSGKSTYIDEHHFDGRVLNTDEAIWRYLEFKIGKKEMNNYRNILKDFFDKDMFDFFRSSVAELSECVDWNEFFAGMWDSQGGFNYTECIDFANFGTFLNDIPVNILANFKLVEIKTSHENRLNFCTKKGWSVEKLKKLDILYKDPEFLDETIFINKNS